MNLYITTKKSITNGGFNMRIINYKIKLNEIIYEVETVKNNKFTHALPKETPSYKVRKILKLLEKKVDEDK